jgi:hypothetical protein
MPLAGFHDGTGIAEVAVMLALSRSLVCIALVVGLQVTTWSGSGASGGLTNPFEFLAPWIVVSSDDRARLDRDQVIARTLPGPKAQLGVFVATRLNAQPDVLAAWTRAIAELKRSRFVLAVGRFSDPPRPSDLDGLTLDERDLDALRRCRPGACGLKLSAAEIGALTGVAARASADWRHAIQREFRRLLVARVNQYRVGGLAASSPPADRPTTETSQKAFEAIVNESPYLMQTPAVVSWLTGYPHADAAVESFFYWSKEHYAEGKPVVSVTHVGIVHSDTDRRLPAVLVASKQIFATHYVEGGLGLTMVVRDDATGTTYLAYVNRSQVDLLRGWFGGLVRSVLADRLERHAPQIVRSLRARLESGAPPGGPGDPFLTESRMRVP